MAPVALVGCGMGAAAALALAQQNPFLAGAVLAGEFALPVAALQEAGAPSGNHGDSGGSPEAAAAPAPGQAVRPAVRQAAQAALSSKQLLPWWGFQAGQATAFESIEHCAAFLAHPLANLSPGVVAPLASAATAAADAASAPGSDELSAADAATSVRQLLAQLQRPLRGAVASACSLLRLPPRMAGGGWGSHYLADEGEEQLQPRTDPSLLFHFDAAALLAGLPSLRCHLLLLHGSRGSWVAPADAAATAALAASGSAASAAVAELPGAGHWLATDQPDALLQRIVGFLEGPAIRCFSRAALVAAADGAGHAGSNGADARRPEVLDLKPLPQYASLEEAQKVGVGIGCTGQNVSCPVAGAAWRAAEAGCPLIFNQKGWAPSVKCPFCLTPPLLRRRWAPGPSPPQQRWKLSWPSCGWRRGGQRATSAAMRKKSRGVGAPLRWPRSLPITLDLSASSGAAAGASHLVAIQCCIH